MITDARGARLVPGKTAVLSAGVAVWRVRFRDAVSYFAQLDSPRNMPSVSRAGTIVVNPDNGIAKRGSEADTQSAQNGLLHEGQPAAGRAQDARPVGRGE